MMRGYPVRLIATVAFLAVALGAWSQETQEPLQRGFGNVRLGMGLDAVKSALTDDPNFRYRGDPDVSFLPSTSVPIIEASGLAFIETGLFQFSDESLYIITLVLNRARLDYFTVYRSLVVQYGEPTDLDPDSATWTDDATTIVLERPVTVKYIDRVVFEQHLESGRLEKASGTLTTERFLEQL